MATVVAERVFVDTNVLVFANVAESPLHKVALSKLRELRDTGSALWISNQVLREFLAVRSRKDLFKEVCSASTLAERVRYFQTHFRVGADSAMAMDALLAIMERVPVAGKQVHDANIVATMQVHGVRHLLTDNVGDFKRFAFLITIIPLVPQPEKAAPSTRS
jgi:predicted nucleic acid-binding protein